MAGGAHDDEVSGHRPSDGGEALGDRRGDFRADGDRRGRTLVQQPDGGRVDPALDRRVVQPVGDERGQRPSDVHMEINVDEGQLRVGGEQQGQGERVAPSMGPVHAHDDGRKAAGGVDHAVLPAGACPTGADVRARCSR